MDSKTYHRLAHKYRWGEKALCVLTNLKFDPDAKTHLNWIPHMPPGGYRISTKSARRRPLNLRRKVYLDGTSGSIISRLDITDIVFCKLPPKETRIYTNAI